MKKQKTKTKGQKISASLKYYHKHKKSMSDVKFLAGVILTIATVSILIKVVVPTALASDSTRNVGLMTSYDKKEITVIDKIIKGAQESGTDIDEALNVIYCESRFNPNAKNSHSTASGCAQFIEGTWDNYCEGDVFNEDDNLKCFFKLYNSHKGWWACSTLLGYK